MKWQNITISLRKWKFPSIIETYIIRKGKSWEWTSVPQKDKKFKQLALKYFGHISHLNRYISEDILTEKNMYTIAKIAEYYHKYESRKRIYFNEQWQEITNKAKSSFYGEITSLEKDSIWTIEYYNHENQKLYEGQYSSFYPHRKNGDFVAYYTDGKIRQKDVYEKNILKTTSTFLKNGTPHYVYNFRKKLIYDYNYTSHYDINYSSWKITL